MSMDGLQRDQNFALVLCTSTDGSESRVPRSRHGVLSVEIRSQLCVAAVKRAVPRRSEPGSPGFDASGVVPCPTPENSRQRGIPSRGYFLPAIGMYDASVRRTLQID